MMQIQFEISVLSVSYIVCYLAFVSLFKMSADRLLYVYRLCFYDQKNKYKEMFWDRQFKTSRGYKYVGVEKTSLLQPCTTFTSQYIQVHVPVSIIGIKLNKL